MLARTVCRGCCSGGSPRLLHRATRATPKRMALQQCRRYSSPGLGASPGAGSSSSPSAGPSPAALLAPFTSELDRISPAFHIHGSQVQILQTPSEFYETLKDKIRHAESRIFLSTLYIGSGEADLIATLQHALRAKPDLNLSILTDALRGTREAPGPSCASLLAPLVAEFGPGRVEIRMYHTPNMTGWRKKVVPRRINEGWGLQHIKLYGVDDEIIMSGANLSTDYFTNRQDRYHLFRSKDITQYFSHLHDAVASLSFLVSPAPTNPAGFDVSWPDTNSGPSPLEDPGAFVKEASGLLSGLISPQTAPRTAHDAVPADRRDTTVYVVAQLSQLLTPDTSTELPAVASVFRTLRSPRYAGSSWHFTAGYFNPASWLTRLLVSTTAPTAPDGAEPHCTGTVITAAPQANGFYGSRGVSGMLPQAYTLLARRFLNAVHRDGRDAAIALREWRRGTVGQPGGWTYHAKGLWITLPPGQQRKPGRGGEEEEVEAEGENDGPAITLVGSSNYTRRSYSLDLEAGALVVTRNADLRRRLGEEVRWLSEHAAPTTREDLASAERRVGWDVRLAMMVVRLLGGSL